MRSINEIRSLTGLRGVAAMYVLLFHYFPLTTYANPLKRVLSHGYLAVDLFFVLSGFVMALNYRHLFASGWSRSAFLTFLGRRIARIYPLYLVATVAGFVLVVAAWLPYVQTVPLAAAFFFNVLMVQAWGLAPSFDSPAWSISAEWAAYLLFPAVLVPAMFRKPPVAWLTAFLCMGILAALCALPPSVSADYLVQDPLNMNGYWLGLPVLRCIPEFTLGILAFRVAATPFGRRITSSGWIAPVLCLVAFVLLAIPKSDLAVVLLFPVLVLGLASETHVPGRILASPAVELVGKLSFSIYLTHKLLFGLLTWLYLQAHAAGLPHARSYAAIVCIALTIGISFFAYRVIEVPGRRWIRELSNRSLHQPRISGAATAGPNEA